MKNLKYLFGIFSLVMVMTSCDDYLEVDAPSSFDTDYVFSNPDDAKKMVLGVYALFAQDTYTSRMSCIWMQNTDVEVIAPGVSPDGSRRDIWSLQGGLLTGFSDIYKAWNDNYLTIDRANQCIEGIKASSVAGDKDMKMLLGEAYCLRAFRYYLLCNFWGDVPYFTESAKAGMVLDAPKTDKNYIYTGCIQDLVNCEADMFFADQFSDGIERMNREYAIGMIARLALFRAGYGMTKDGIMKRADEYLDVTSDEKLAVTYTDLDGNTKVARTYKEYYQLAKDYSQKLVTLKDRELNPDFKAIFKNECEWIKTVNDDVLYEVAFGNVNGGGDVGWCIGVSVSASTKGTTTTQLGLSPAYYFSFDDADKRRDVTVSLVSYTSDTEQKIASLTSLVTGKWNRLWLKTSPGASSSKGTGINWPLMRYSDVLLMLAEAENELNGPTSIAKDALKRVRNRAFAAEDKTVKVEEYVNNLSNSTDFFNAIVNERAWEFGGECLRKFDLVRWNNYGAKIVETKAMINNIGKACNGLELENPEVAKYVNYADQLYYSTNSDGSLNLVNPKYDLETLPESGQYTIVSWGKSLYKKVTDANTGEVTYESADFTTRCWRGYKDETGLSAVPYLLPISSSTIGASEVLTNDGYGFVFSAN